MGIRSKEDTKTFCRNITLINSGPWKKEGLRHAKEEEPELVRGVGRV